jgi:TetR/AcrR family transcriptional regulator, lmrAB and yxaGH operons repressor
MVVSAASLIGTHGATATALSDVLNESGAPRGSIYHHFPAGKKELVGEAMQWTTEQVLSYQRRCTASTAPGVLEHFVALFRASVVSSGCRAGCPVAGVLIDTYSDDAGIMGIGRASFRSWISLIARQLEGVGMTPPRARSLAVTTLASVEGALILCRAEGSVAPLDTVVGQLRQLAMLPGPVGTTGPPKRRTTASPRGTPRRDGSLVPVVVARRAHGAPRGQLDVDLRKVRR